MITTDDLRLLQGQVKQYKGRLSLQFAADGTVHSIMVSGLPGIGRFPMPPIQGAERVRQWLSDNAWPQLASK